VNHCLHASLLSSSSSYNSQFRHHISQFFPFHHPHFHNTSYSSFHPSADPAKFKIMTQAQRSCGTPRSKRINNANMYAGLNPREAVHYVYL